MSELFSLYKSNKVAVGSGGGLNNMVILVAQDDVQSIPARGLDKTTIAGSIVMKPGKTMSELYTTNKTLEPTMKYAAGENQDCYGWECGFAGFHPGLEKAVLEFCAKNGAFKGLVLLRSADKIYMLGSLEEPVALTGFDFKWGKAANEGKGSTLTFSSIQQLPWAVYEGTIQLAQPTLVAAGATTFAFEKGKAFNLTSGAAAAVVLASVTGMEDGDVVAINGTGGQYPTTIASGPKFILANGATWTATAGASITLKAFKGDAGAIILIEQCRS